MLTYCSKLINILSTSDTFNKNSVWKEMVNQKAHLIKLTDFVIVKAKNSNLLFTRNGVIFRFSYKQSKEK